MNLFMTIVQESMIKALKCQWNYAHQIPPHLSFCTPRKNTLLSHNKSKEQSTSEWKNLQQILWIHNG